MTVEILAIPGIPDIKPGDDLAEIIFQAAAESDIAFQHGDILAVAQKIVSKAEGRYRSLHGIVPTARALSISEQCGKDPRKVQAILDESSAIVRVKRALPDGIVIARHLQGWVCANAAIDESNLDCAEGSLLLLPRDPDASARSFAQAIQTLSGAAIGAIITDTFGRPWRKGLVNVAIGSSKVPPIVDWVGRNDAYGRVLKASQQAFADEIAAASGLVMEKDAKTPVALFRGLRWNADEQASCAAYVREEEQDLFK